LESSWFFGSWDGLLRVVSIGALAYFGILLLLRLFGNRTLAKSAAFDHVVTVAFGSALATTLLSKQTPLAEGIGAFLALVLLQFVIAWLISRSSTLQNVFVHRPTVVLESGHLDREAMKRARVSNSDVHAALRKAGIGRMEEAALVVLESDGTFAVVREVGKGPIDAVEGIADQLRLDGPGRNRSE
jgi:uncharacterized membrane protein YcaP (DUF421 family)